MDATVIVGSEAYTLQSDKIVLRSKTESFNFNLKINNENILLTGAVQDDKVIERSIFDSFNRETNKKISRSI